MASRFADDCPRDRAASIRPARPDDCAALTALMLRSRAYDGPYRAIIEHYPVTPDMVEKGEVWLAEAAGEIAGFYRLDLERADLDLMFVDDCAQGLGVGRMLFDHMAELAARSGLAEVGIVAHPPAADFYRKMGAVDRGTSQPSGTVRWARPILALPVRR